MLDENKMKKELRKAFQDSLNILTDEIRKVTPVDTGRLRNSIHIEEIQDKRDVLEGIVGTDVEYACVFGAHTSIKTKEGFTTIGQIKKGDLVLTQDGEYHKVVRKTKIPAILKPELVTLIVEWRKDKNHELTLTSDHKVLVYSNNCLHWKKAGELTLDDRVFTPIKKPKNKSMKKAPYKTFHCVICKKPFDVTLNTLKYRNPKYCSIECRNIGFGSELNPHLGRKRSKKSRELMRKRTIERFRKNPEQHPNKILAKKGYQSNIEKTIEKWLKNKKLVFKKQVRIGKYWVDFYIPDKKLIIEADGAFWHQDQTKDIERDKQILALKPDHKIFHFHFVDKRFSKNIKSNPLPNVYYIQLNPGLRSYVNLEVFKPVKIISIKQWTYKRPKKHGGTNLYDLTIDGFQSFIANGIIISNSFVEYGTSKMAPRAMFRRGTEAAKPKIKKALKEALKRAMNE